MWLPRPHDFVRFVVAVGVVFFVLTFLLVLHLPDEKTLIWKGQRRHEVATPCAIALYGLPRSFRALVLPSLIRNVIQPNAMYNCDYYVYFHDATQDLGGRDDRSGTINSQEVFLLRDAVKEYHTPTTIQFDSFTDDNFFKTNKALLQTIYASLDQQGRPLFLPYNHPSYSNSSIINVVKMWHAQEALWNMIDSYGITQHYSRVAMLRLDVVYVTPINIYELPNKTIDYDNAVAVIPNFGRHPVSDRMMYGPFEALQAWAAQRIQRLAQHAQYIAQHAPGDGIHSERYLNSTIFPVIRQRGISIETHPDLCFLRARADGAVRLTDCGTRHTTRHNYLAVQSILGTCLPNMTHLDRSIVLLECGNNEVQDNKTEIDLMEWSPGCFIDEKTPPPNRKKANTKPCIPPHISMFKRVHAENTTELSGYDIL
jgi:hypothetical protein